MPPVNAIQLQNLLPDDSENIYDSANAKLKAGIKPPGGVELPPLTLTPDQQITALKAQRGPLYEEVNNLNKSIYSPDTTPDYGNDIVKALLTFAPLIAGRALGGPAGGVVGGQAGAMGVQQFQQGLDKNELLQNQAKVYQLEDKTGQLKDLNQVIKEMTNQSNQEKTKREDKATDRTNALTDKETFYDYAQAHQKVSPDEAQTFHESDDWYANQDSINDRTPGTTKKMYEGQNRHNLAIGVQIGGSDVKPVSQVVQERLFAGKDAMRYIQQMEIQAQKMSQDPGVINALQAGRLVEQFRNPDSPAYNFDKFAGPLQDRLTKLAAGRVSEQSLNKFKALSTGDMTYSGPETMINAVKDVKGITTNLLTDTVKTAKELHQGVGDINLDEFLPSSTASADTSNMTDEQKMQRIAALRAQTAALRGGQ